MGFELRQSVTSVMALPATVMRPSQAAREGRSGWFVAFCQR